jgi:hypothetical protein
MLKSKQILVDIEAEMKRRGVLWVFVTKHMVV